MNNSNLASSFKIEKSFESPIFSDGKYKRIMFLTCPTGAYCREDRCQSFFEASLIPSMRPPLEECEAGGAIASCGSDFIVIDSPALNLSEVEVFKKITKFNPDLIVLSVTFGSLDEDLKWSKLLKEKFPSIPLGLRGAPCYVEPENILKLNRCIDFCLHGDYELIFASIIEVGLSHACGVTYRNSIGEISNSGLAIAEDLNQLPLPDRSGIDSELYKVRGIGQSQATIRVQRGCPFPCTYCLVHTVSGKRARHRNPESIAKEMKDLFSAGIRFFYLRAETFSLDKDWALSVCSQIAIQCPGVFWVTTTRVEHVDSEILKAMKASGCYGISFGLDVASETISKFVKKPIRLNEAIEVMRLCNTYGIISLAYIMIGFIWETKETLRESLDFVKLIKPDLLTIHFAHPYPGTVYYNQVKEMQQIHKIVSLRAQAEPALDLEELSTEELKKFAKMVLVSHYRRPKVISAIAIKLFKLRINILISRISQIISPRHC